MKPAAVGIEDRDQSAPEPQPATKLVMKGVITHEFLLDKIEERNPIIANRVDKRPRKV